MLSIKIRNPFVIGAFDDMIYKIFKQKNFYEYDVTSHTQINGLKRYIVDFNNEKGDVIFSGIIDIWQESEKTYVEFEEL